MAAKDTKVQKVGGTRSFLLTARSARALVRTGQYEYVKEVIQSTAPPAPVPPSDGLDALTYWQVRHKAEEAGLEVEGRTKADYLAALRGSYVRRDMRAED